MLGRVPLWHGQETVLFVYPTYGESASSACDQLIQLFHFDGGAAYGVKDMRNETRRNVIDVVPDCSPEIYKTESPQFLEHKLKNDSSMFGDIS